MDYALLNTTRLFNGVNKDDIVNVLKCLEAKVVDYPKDSIIYHEGDQITSIGLVLEGRVNICHNDYLGNQEIIKQILVGHIFGETYAYLKKKLLIEVEAVEDTKILFLNINKLMTTCGNNCSYHSVIIANLYSIAAERNISMSKRMIHVSFKSLRSRLLSYFNELANEIKSNHITIPFTRQELADYLNVDRSAMCTELTKMKNDGYILVNKNSFTLLKNEVL